MVFQTDSTDFLRSENGNSAFKKRKLCLKNGHSSLRKIENFPNAMESAFQQFSMPN